MPANTNSKLRAQNRIQERRVARQARKAASNRAGDGNDQNTADKKKQGGRNNKKKDKKAVTVALAPAQAFEAAPTFEEQLEALNNTSGVDNMKVIAGADGINTIEAYSGSTLVASLTYAGDTLYSWNFLTDGATSHPTVIDASAATAGVTIVGTSGNDTIIASTLEGNADTIRGGEGDDYIQVASADRLAAADIFGGEGVNTLAVGDITGTTAQTIVDGDLADKLDIDVLRVGNGGNDVVLGENAALAGIGSLIGGTGADTFDATGMTSAVTLEGGGGADVLTGGTAGTAFVFDSIAQYATAATISATAGNNVISFASATSHINLIEKSWHFNKLVGNANIGTIEGATNASTGMQLGINAQLAGVELVTVNSGTHALSLHVIGEFTNALNIRSAGGADSFRFENEGVLNIMSGSGDDTMTFVLWNGMTGTDNLTIDAGEGIDSVFFDYGYTPVTLNDASFANFTSVEILHGKASAQDAFTLGTNASRAGLQSLFGGSSSDDSYTFDGFSTSLWIEATGNDTFYFTSQANFTSAFNDTSAVQISGGEGRRTISFSNAVGAISLTDAKFASVTNIQSLVLGNGSNEFTLGTSAAAAGIDTVKFSGTGAHNINATGFTNALTFDVTGTTFAALIQGGSGTGDTLRMDVSGLSGESMFDPAALLAAQVTGVENLIISGFSSNVTLSSVIKSYTGSTYADTFDATGMTSAVTLKGGGGADVLTGGTAGTTFVFDSIAHYTAAATISAAGGNNVISFASATPAITLLDSHFSRLVGNVDLGTVQGSGGAANTATFGTTAQAAGLDAFVVSAGTSNGNYTVQSGFTNALDITAASGANTFTIQNTGSLDLVSGSGNDTYNISSRTNTTNLTINAGAGNDTVSFAGASAVTLNDASFATLTSVETLIGSNSAANAFTLGTNASRAGLQSVTGGANDDSFIFDGFATSLVMNGGGGNDTFYFNSQANFTTAISNASAVEIVGGAGTNTISFSNAAGALSISDAQFASMTNIQSLVLGNGSNEITLGTRAAAAGIDTLIGGTGTDWLNAADFTGGITLQGWSSVSGAGENQSNDTLTGDAGTAGVDVFVLGDATSNAYGSGYANEALIQNFDSNDKIVLAGITGQSGSISFSGNVGEITFGSDTTPVYTLIASMGAGTSAVLRNQVGENIARFASAEVDLRTLANSNFQFMA